MGLCLAHLVRSPRSVPRRFPAGRAARFSTLSEKPFALKAAPLALTDEQLTQVMRHAAVLHPQLRRVFVEHLAYELRGRTIGDWRRVPGLRQGAEGVRHVRSARVGV